MADLLAALSAPRRQAIVQLVLGRELAAGEIHRAIGEVSFGAISQHLRLLTEAGALSMRREGRRRLYRARLANLRPFRRYLERLWDDKLAALAALAEAEASAEDAARDRADAEDEKGSP